MLNEVLLPCPFCGCEGEVIERHNPMSKWRWSVDCGGSTCGASGPVEASKADATAAWNTRTPPPTPPSDEARAREVLKAAIAAHNAADEDNDVSIWPDEEIPVIAAMLAFAHPAQAGEDAR